MAATTLKEGDRVEVGEKGVDYGAGVIDTIEHGFASVIWDRGGVSDVPLANLRPHPFVFDDISPAGHLINRFSTATRSEPGSQVVVGDHPMERECAGRCGLLLGFTEGKGFAALQSGDDVLLIHPEALEAR